MGDAASLLAPWQWMVLAALPVLMVLLYFLKLRREPVEVPSTFLWKKSIDDLHVNSLWQRLRRSLLLLLQLLVLLLAILALLLPYWGEGTVQGERYIFLIDNSASMSASDLPPSRLDQAKAQVLKFLDEEKRSQDVVMIVSFADGARVWQEFTTGDAELKAALGQIQPSNHRTNIDDALTYAAGLAKAARGSGSDSDEPADKPLPTKMFILSDGNFTPPSFSLGSLEASYVPLGDSKVRNLGIVAFSAGRPDERSSDLRIFGRIENHGPQDEQALVELRVDGQPVDVKQVTVPAGGAESVVFTQKQLETAVLELRLNIEDALAADNRAWSVVNPPRRGKVLLVTPGNRPLEFALQTGRAQSLADLLIESPEFLRTEAYQGGASSGLFDLIIYDRCLPPPAQPGGNASQVPTPLPQANTWFIGAVPQQADWGWKPGATWPAVAVAGPQIIDLERTHPVMQLLDVERTLIAEATPLTPPTGSVTLIDAVAQRPIPGGDQVERVQVPIFAIAPRQGYEDAVLGFSLVDEQGPNTDWFKRRSFAALVLNILQYLGGAQSVGAAESIRPGERVEIQTPTAADTLQVVTPSGKTAEAARAPGNVFRYLGTEELGVYEVREGGQVVERFAVNLFDSQESNLKPRAELDFEWNKIRAETDTRPQPRDGWKNLLFLALLVLLIEWYIYNRRVYL